MTDSATIGRSLIIKGEVTGSGSLHIDGRVEGAIHLPGHRVTIGRTGQVAANIHAREIVVIGKVLGNCQATDRIDIRGEGSLTGDVITRRISIEDGAFFRGGIDIRQSDEDVTEATYQGLATRDTARAKMYDKIAGDEIANGQYEVLDDEADFEGVLSKWRSETPALMHSRSAR